MTKYYYSCPLSAAYMAKNFGMRFLLEGEEFDEWGAEIRDLWPDFGEDTAIKYHIHPDSLHLLAPRPGDLVVCDDKYRHIWAATGVPLDWGSLNNLRGNDQYLEVPRFLEDRELKRIRKDGITKIIQRQKMPFHWPEKSCAESALKKAKRQTEKSTTEIMTDDDSQSLNPHLFETLNG